MPMSKEREYRKMILDIEKRADNDQDQTMIVSGYASTFDEPYILFDGKYSRIREVVDRNAFDNTDMSDVIMQYDHEGRVIARGSNNTLEVTPDEKGLYIKADLSGTKLGRELYEEIKNGYINKMSFGFTIGKREEIRTELDDGRDDYLIRILEVSKLYDVSAVSIPANDGTSIGARTRDHIDGVIEKVKAERLNDAKVKLKKSMLKKGVTL